MKRGFVDIPEGQIHYRTEGSGEPLLLLHATGSSSAAFRHLIPLLSPNYHVIAMDYPGYGDSDPAPRQYTMADYARSVLSFLDALEIQRTSIVGETTGANVAGEVAAEYPERVDKLVLHNCPYWKYLPNQLRYFGDYLPVEFTADGSHLLEKWQRATQGREDVPLEEIQRDVLIMLQAQLSPKRGEESHHAVFTYEAQLRLPLVKSPTLVMTTEGGGFHRRAEDVHNALPQSKLVNIPNVPSNFVQHAPWEYAAVVLDFLKNAGI